jgi:hypothetical protein
MSSEKLRECERYLLSTMYEKLGVDCRDRLPTDSGHANVLTGKLPSDPSKSSAIVYFHRNPGKYVIEVDPSSDFWGQVVGIASAASCMYGVQVEVSSREF